MKYVALVLTMLTALPAISKSQTLDTLWTRALVTGPNLEYRIDIALTYDGDIVVASLDSIRKVDSSGQLVWSRSGLNGPFAVEETSDSGLILAGRYHPGQNDAMALKTNRQGLTQWYRTWTAGCIHEVLMDVVEAENGDFVFAGRTSECAGQGYNNNFYVVRRDRNGNPVWEVNFPISPPYQAERICRAESGCFLVVGSNWPFQSPEIGCHILKVNNLGETVWECDYAYSARSAGKSIVACGNGSYAVAGFSSTVETGDDFWLFKINENGDTLWSKSYLLPGDQHACDVIRLADGGYLLTGWTDYLTAGDRDMFLLRTNGSGDSLWTMTLGGSQRDEGHAAVRLPDGSYVISGLTYSYGSAVWLVRTQPDPIVCGHGAAFVQLISPGPPAWGYRLVHVQGSVSRLVFTNFCLGTIPNLTGSAATRWAMLPNGDSNNGDSIVFLSTTPLTTGTIDTFWLSHPYCAAQVTWTAGDSSGSVDGPLPVELLGLSVAAVPEGIEVQWNTASETNNDFFEIMRGASETGAFTRIATLPSQGNSASGHHYEYLDREVTAGQTYWYYLADVDLSGNRTEHRELMRSATMTGSAELPSDYALAAYPNPFNPSTTISFALPEADFVRIAVFDVAGRWIQTLVNEKRAAGRHSVTFDARDLPSGVYFARMEAAAFTMTKKMLLIR